MNHSYIAISHSFIKTIRCNIPFCGKMMSGFKSFTFCIFTSKMHHFFSDTLTLMFCRHA